MARIDEDTAFDEAEIRVAERRLATAVQPMSSVSIRPLRTEGSGHLATVWFEASSVSGPPADNGPTVETRGVILWRKEPDGRWRVAIEHLG